MYLWLSLSFLQTGPISSAESWEYKADMTIVGRIETRIQLTMVVVSDRRSEDSDKVEIWVQQLQILRETRQQTQSTFLF